jgi:hypothetical protein
MRRALHRILWNFAECCQLPCVQTQEATMRAWISTAAHQPTRIIAFEVRRQHYLDRAEESLCAAGDVKDPAAKKALFDRARAWATLAERSATQSIH